MKTTKTSKQNNIDMIPIVSDKKKISTANSNRLMFPDVKARVHIHVQNIQINDRKSVRGNDASNN